MNSEVKKKMTTCLMLWGMFVLIKWVMLLSPSSVFYKLGPLSVVMNDGEKNYTVSGWISLGIETALAAAFFLLRVKKVNILYILCTVYSFLYIPSTGYWIFKLEFEVWRYVVFLPAIVCCSMMMIYFPDYAKMPKLKRPVKSKTKQSGDGEQTEDTDEKSSEQEEQEVREQE